MISQIKSFGLRHSINPMELNFDLLEDEDLSQLIIEECIKLLQMDRFEVGQDRHEVWFKKLWNLLVFGSNKRRIDNVQTYAECKHIFVEILESYLSFHPRRCGLIIQILKRLEESSIYYQYVVDLLSQHQFEVVRSQGEIVLKNNQLIYQWDESKKMLLIKMMILASYADEIVSHEEEQLINWTIDVLLDDRQNKRKCQIYLENPQHLDQLLKSIHEIEDEVFKKTIFENCLKVIVVDNHLNLMELDSIHKLETILGIEEKDRKALDYLLTHFSKPDYPIEQVTRWQHPQSNEDVALFLSHLRNYVSLSCWQYLSPLLIKLNRYYSYSNTAPVKDIIHLFSAEKIRKQFLCV